jgi:hypothetical protein
MSCAAAENSAETFMELNATVIAHSTPYVRALPPGHRPYTTPPPGHYDVNALDMTKFKNPAVTSFGGNLSKVDREKTGLRAEALKNANLPGPDR